MESYGKESAGTVRGRLLTKETFQMEIGFMSTSNVLAD